jgi:2-keto-4-pentenoate hydratase/2-oxohepta-3-ene-1,7-dioic acid hydratase in catechol pathway
MFATYVSNGIRYWGVADKEGMIALSPDFPQWKTLRNVIEAGGLEEVANAASGRPVTHPHGSFTYEIPVPDPEKIICVGVNFPTAMPNTRTARKRRRTCRCSSASRAPLSATVPLIRPKTPQLDYEGEIAIVIGKGGRRIPEADALSHIAA